MGAPAYGAVLLFALALAAGAAAAETARPEEPTLPAAAGGGGDGVVVAAAAVVNGSGAGVNSNSVLVALLDSHYTELAELVEKALLLQTLEDAVGRHNVTIFAPRNEALERDLDPEFKRFLLEPRNLKSLQTLLLFHVLPARHPAGSWPAASHPTLSGEDVELAAGANGSMRVAHAAVTRPDAVLRPDGVIHGIERLLVPRSVQEDFNRRRSLAAISAVLPTGAPEVDPRTHRLKKPAPPVLPGAPPVLPVWDAMAPGPLHRPRARAGPGQREAPLRRPQPGQGLHPDPGPLRRVQRAGRHPRQPHLAGHRDGPAGVGGVRADRAGAQRRGHGAADHGPAERARVAGEHPVLPHDPGVPDGGEHVQRRPPVRQGAVRHAAAAAQGGGAGGGRLRQVRAGRGLRLPLRPGHLHRRQDLGAGHRRRAAAGGRQEAGHAGVRPGQEGARRHRLQEEQAPARQVVGGNVQNGWRLRSASRLASCQ
uniref:Fasciclin-like protein FLA19 n=1 Tax=Triticum aestivum TaxID=4565 RepID=Q06I87_WHEAT|nr:fasciclin-like protein FLA19 [Triticum aestivum]